MKKRILLFIITSILLLDNITFVNANTSILNTNKALNSPILNNNATSDEWNKWELICWGVFLSNWCVPLIDTYETAYSSSSGNGRSSNGDGFKALAFGSGNDINNNEIIKDFTNYAVKVQKETQLKPIYVVYNKITDNKFEAFKDPNVDDSVAREATIQDMFFKWDKATADNTTTTIKINTSSIQNYASKYVEIPEAYIPTFYIKKKNNGGYVKILDYTNSWDIQAVSSMINAIRNDKSERKYSEYFSEEFNKIVDETNKDKIALDVFGNIVLPNRTMVFPASNNQNITETPSINVLNSWIMNNYITPESETKVLEELHQGHIKDSTIYKVKTFFNGHTDTNFNFFPAISGTDKSVLGTYGMFYFDSDSIGIRNLNNNGTRLKYGEILKELFECDISNDKNRIPIKFEVTSQTNFKTKFPNIFAGGSTELNPYMKTEFIASIIPNINNSNNSKVQPKILDSIILQDGSKQKLYKDKPIAVPVQVVSKSHDKGEKDGEAMRYFVNWLYKGYTGEITNTTYGTISHNLIKSNLELADTPESMKNIIDDNNTGLLKYFKATYPEFDKADINADKVADVGNNESFNDNCARVILAYPVSNVMSAVSQILSLADGAEFNVYSTIIYMTYLDWYGVVNKTSLTLGKESKSKFNKDIYDETDDILKIDPSTISEGIKTKEEKEEEVLNYGYLMLHPKEGREYRKKMVYSGISDFIYEQYNRLVFGSSSDKYGGTASKANSGFLSVPTYQENFLTGFLIRAYSKIIVLLLGIVILIIVVLGILKSKKFSWYVVSISLMVTVLLLLPSSGEITPYITTSAIQKIFNNKMTFWTISEGVANSELEHSAVSGKGVLDGLNDTEAQTVLKLVNQLSVVYTDRSLMFKQDISQKITQKLGGIYSNIQQIKSARWVLPMLMQQFSSNIKSDSEKYLYVKLGNVWTDASNLYWYYDYDDATSVTKMTSTSQQFMSSQDNTGASNTLKANTVEKSEETRGYVKNTLKYDGLKNTYKDLVEPSWRDKNGTLSINYHNYSYNINKDNNSNVHLYMWGLHNDKLGMNNISKDTVFGTDFSGYESLKSWGKYIDTAKSSLTKENWDTAINDTLNENDRANKYELIAEEYDRTDTSTLYDGYGYYKTTESPFYYLFSVVKDSFSNEKAFGAIIGQLQGKIKTDNEGNEVRTNFMYATKTSSEEEYNGYDTTNSDVEYTGYTRDILDLQYMFNNVIPYMYEMTLASGGFDGDSGILGNEKIESDMAYYKGSNKSWAYRCNWATKLMENPQLAGSQSIRLADGSVVEVKNAMLPQAYRAVGRDMVFSEAQREALWLQDKDLSTVELKCIELNKEVARDWTLLINYTSTSGLTKEVLFKTMATSSLEKFNRKFSGNGLFDTKYDLYPQSVDLRHLSFDAVIKMLIVNATKDTSYAYGSSVENMISSESMVSQILLLIDALIGATIINFLQSSILAMILYFSVFSITKALIAGSSYKTKIAGATLLQNITFTIYTVGYYWIISLYMSMTSQDEVLSVSSMKTSSGSPIMTLFIFLIISIIYTGLMGLHIRFLIQNVNDMGVERIGFALSAIKGFMGDRVEKITSGISNIVNREETISSSGTGNTESISGTGSSKESTQNVNITNNEDKSVTVNNEINNEVKNDDIEISSASYNFNESDIEFIDNTSSADIDAEIKAGEEIK